MISLFNLLNLVPLLGIGIICTYTDIKYNKIFNKIILAGLLYGFFLYTGMFLLQRLKIDYFLKIALNTGISLTIGYALWHFKLWTAGDAKLFTLYSFLIPLEFYSKAYLPYFPSFSILVNLFFPLLICLALMSFLYRLRLIIKKEGINFSTFSFSKLKKGAIETFFEYSFFVFIISFFNFLRETIESYFNIKRDLLFKAGLLAIIFYSIRKFKNFTKDKKGSDFIIFLFAVFFSFYFFINGEIKRLEFIFKLAILFTLLMFGLRRFINSYIQKKEVTYKKINELEEGNSLTEKAMNIIKIKTKNDKRARERAKKIPYSIRKKDITFLKKLFRDNLEKKIETYKTFPFAPFLLMAVLITIIWKSSFAVIIRRILEIL